MSETTNSHLFAVRTTGGQEKVVLRLLETKMRSGGLDIQSILLVDNLKGYIVIHLLIVLLHVEVLESH